uniref:Putative secreted protein n=1 Tax=Ixodes ricinus TaxID=34613 RepID=A0A6B0U4E7_IXORI
MTLNKFLIILCYTWRTVKATDPATQQERRSEARENMSRERLRGLEKPAVVCSPRVVCCETNQPRMNVHRRNNTVP